MIEFIVILFGWLFIALEWLFICLAKINDTDVSYRINKIAGVCFNIGMAIVFAALGISIGTHI